MEIKVLEGKKEFEGGKMESWEEAILIQQESEEDECAMCQHKGIKCRNQCMEIKNVHNPYLTEIREWVKHFQDIAN